MSHMVSMRLSDTTYDVVMRFATSEHRTFTGAVEYLLKTHPEIDGEPEAHVASRAGIVGGATAKAGSTPDSGAKVDPIQNLVSQGLVTKGVGTYPVEDIEEPSQEVDFDDLGQEAKRVKCPRCQKLMRPMEGNQMVCPMGHKLTLTELRGKGLL